ncbi:MAG: hypothetical protein AAB436_01385 [Patescibacteria group bacterium]
MKYQYKKGSAKSNQTKLIILGVAVLIIGGFFAVKHFNQTKDIIPASTPKESKTKTVAKGTSDKQNNASSSVTASGSDKTTASSDATLLMPSGTFVSNHHPSLSSSETAQEQSVCNTTVGATCEIRFTRGSETKKLEAKTTDSNGSVYWSWEVGTAGLGTGSWQITAYATLNGKTLSSSDSINLEVSP